MREIGSEFWEVPVTDKENGIFPNNTQWFISGRTALKSIISELKEYHTVAIPSWYCESMVKPFIDAGFDVRLYPVYFHNTLIQEYDLSCDVLFVMDYFGYTGTSRISQYDGIIIRDVTHSIMSSEYSDADYYFGSLRKWCGFYTGGYAWSRDGRVLACSAGDDLGYVSLRKEAMILKNKYIMGESKDKCFLSIFHRAESLLDKIDIVSASSEDILLAQKMNVDWIRSKRRTNAGILREAFPNILLFKEMKETDCPMFVPVFIPDNKRDLLMNFLIQHEIYCPIHWPKFEGFELSEHEKLIYDNELSLVCDQRYSVEDMNRIVEVINLFWKAER